MNELEIGKSFLNATTGQISQYSEWCVLYGDKKFSNKELGKRIKAVRKAFYHDGTKEDIENFWTKHQELKNFLSHNKMMIQEQSHPFCQTDVSRSVNEKQEVSYDDIEKLTEDVQEFIKSKGFDIVDEFEFLTRLEKVLYEGIDKHYD